MNPLTRFIGQFEVNLADLTRRTVASVAEPIKAKSQEVVSEVVGAATGLIKAAVIKIVFGLIAAAMLIVAIVYAVAALYWALLPSFGMVETRLILAGVFAIIAVLAVLAMMFWPTGRAPPKVVNTVKAEAAAAQADARVAMAQAQAAATPKPDPAAAATQAGLGTTDLKGGVEALASILGEAGFRREQAGLRTGLALAGQLKPMQIVTLALIGGYVAGLRHKARRRR